MGNVSASTLLINFSHVLCHVDRTKTPIASHRGGAPLQQVVYVGSSIPLQNGFIAMRVKVDKAWTYHQALTIQNRVGGSLEIFSNCDDSPRQDRNIGLKTLPSITHMNDAVSKQ